MYRGRYDAGYEEFKESRWGSAKELGIVPQRAELAERNPLIEPWSDLTEDERRLEARGMEVYAGMLTCMDYHYGRVLDFLKDIGEFENTVIVFLSDNGANPWYSSDYPGATESEFKNQFDNNVENIGHPRSNYAYGMGFASGSGGPLDKFKMTVGEGGIRSPFLIAGPGINGGRRIDAFAYVTDVMPTLLEIADVEYSTEFNGRQVEPMRGRSMLGLLEGSENSIYAPDEFVGGEMQGGRWMRRGDLKAVLVPEPYGTGRWRLHDVVNDPGEANDLSEEMPDKLQALVAAWDEYANDVGVVLPE